MGELGRRLVHASGVVLPAVYLVDLVSWTQLRAIVVVGSALAVILEFLRLRMGVDWWIYRHLTRPYEAEAVAGYALYMLSITVIALVFRPHVALPAMLMLMLGDPVSGYLGSGELRRIKRPLAMGGMFAVAFAVTAPFAATVTEELWAAAAVAAVGAAAGTVADAVKPTVGSIVIDDNLTIPTVGAITLWAAYRIVGGV